MKNLIFLMSALFLFACGNDNGKTESSDAESGAKKIIKSATSNSGDCDEFLTDYEKWVDELIIVYKKVKENPSDMTNNKKLMEITQEMAKWGEKWGSLYDCAKNEDYAQKMEDLQKKAQEAMLQ